MQESPANLPNYMHSLPRPFALIHHTKVLETYQLKHIQNLTSCGTLEMPEKLLNTLRESVGPGINKTSSQIQSAKTIQTGVVDNSLNKHDGSGRRQKKLKLPSTNTIPATRRDQPTLTGSDVLGSLPVHQITDINSPEAAYPQFFD